MNAVRLCATNKAALYLDVFYQCWVVISDLTQEIITPLMGSPLAHYCQYGFGDVDGEEIRKVIPYGISKLLDADTDIELHVLENMSLEAKYTQADMPWYDRCLHQKVLCKLANDPEDLELITGVIQEEGYLYYQIGEESSCSEATPLTDSEIDAVKSEGLEEDWYLKDPCKKVLCYAGDRNPPGHTYLYFINEYQADGDRPGYYSANEQPDMFGNYWPFEFVEPVTSVELDSFLNLPSK